MKEFIEKLHKDVEIDLQKLKDIRHEIVMAGIPLGIEKNARPEWIEHTGDGSIDVLDCVFLTLLMRKLKPKKIFEIGTWFGTSSAILSEALNNEVRIYTCDTQNIYTNFDRYKNNIVFCNTYSSNVVTFLKKNKVKIDFVFADGNLMLSDVSWLLESMGEDFIVAVHDYKLPSDKGIDNINLIKKHSKTPMITFCPTIDIPRKGYNIGKEYNINGSVGLIMTEKLYERVFSK